LLTGVPQHQALLRYKIRRALDEGGD